MKKVFVSGCYDIIHAGHLQFFRDCKALGDWLTVCIASDDVLLRYKHRLASARDIYRRELIESLDCVDEVVIGDNHNIPLNFIDHFMAIKPEILAVRHDDPFPAQKKELCERTRTQYVMIPQNPVAIPLSSSDIRNRLTAPVQVPLRVDFAGGWLDVPRLSLPNNYIVNCTVTPMVSLTTWNYEFGGGLGGSAAKAVLDGKNAVRTELQSVGWQDPAVILETGLCVWRSGKIPVLDLKANPDFLEGMMALLWTGNHHNTPELLDRKRDYQRICAAGRMAREGVLNRSTGLIADSVSLSYSVQLDEGMNTLPDSDKALAMKYCGSGHGGYGLYLFRRQRDRDAFVELLGAIPIEPYLKPIYNTP